jgi:hypothetical protein
VFHVGLLKLFWDDSPATPPDLPAMENGRFLPVPERVPRAQLRRGVWHVEVQWAGMDTTNAMWEPVDQFKASYLDFQLEDELSLEEGRDVMTGITYQRRGKRQRS